MTVSDAGATDPVERYMIISADGHCGAQTQDYKPYLDRKWHEAFDAWAASFTDPWLEVGGGAAKSALLEANWDSALRQKAVESQGIVGEILFPNTYPPFYPSSAIFAVNPATRDEYEHRFAGLQAHNRWLADFCAELPGRRAGIGQVFTNDPEKAAQEIRRMKESGLKAVLLPTVEAGSHQTPYHHPMYEPIWAACADVDITINSHGTGAFQNNYFGTDEPGWPGVPPQVLFTEASYFNAQRTMVHLIGSGVFERYPDLRYAITEIPPGTYWVRNRLRDLDFLDGMTRSRVDQATKGGAAGVDGNGAASMKPSEYFARNVYLGASFMERFEVEMRHSVGVDRLMWGSDFPHGEGTYPYTREALRASFFDVPVDEMRMMLGETAAAVYGFDAETLRDIAAAIGPTVEEVAVPLAPGEYPSYPDETECMALAASAALPY